MVFYVINAIGMPVYVTINKKWSPEQPNAYTIILTKSPLTGGGPHVAAFVLRSRTPYPVPRINVAPQMLYVDNRLLVEWVYGHNKNGDLVFSITNLLC